MARAEALLGTEDVSELRGIFYKSLKPPRRRSVSEWADERRQLDSRSPWPGPWRTAKAPYLREPMDRFNSTDPCRRIVVDAAAQVGKTEIMLNAIGQAMEDDPGPMLAVQGTIELARDWSKDRLQTMIDLTPELKEIIGEDRNNQRDRDADDSIRYKRFRGGSLFLAGANSPAGLRSKPVRRVFMDEVDSYPESAGKEGDPVRLAERRTQNFQNKKIGLFSTPTIKGRSRIEAAYLYSDQRKYYVPCPHCGYKQTLKWANIIWHLDAEDKLVESSVQYACEKNGCLIDEADKIGMLTEGEWIAENPGGGDGRTHGYHISALYSPWKPWVECVQEFLEAKPPGKPVNLHLLQVFVNTNLAETWDDSGGHEADANAQMKRREIWWKGEEIVVPRKAAFLTMGVDTQDDRLEGTVWAWGPGRECWLIDRFIINSPPIEDSTWNDLDTRITRQYVHESGIYIGIAATCVDTGGHHSQDVLRFTNLRKQRRVYGVKGVPGMNKTIWSGKQFVGRRRKTGGTMYPVGVDSAKSWLYQVLNEDESRVHFPLTDFCDMTFFTQLCAEKRKPRYVEGRLSYVWWKPDHVANEMLDATVYAAAAMEALVMAGRRLDGVPVGPPVLNFEGSSTEPSDGEREAKKAPARPKELRRPAPVIREGQVLADRNWLSRD